VNYGVLVNFRSQAFAGPQRWVHVTLELETGRPR